MKTLDDYFKEIENQTPKEDKAEVERRAARRTEDFDPFSEINDDESEDEEDDIDE